MCYHCFGRRLRIRRIDRLSDIEQHVCALLHDLCDVGCAYGAIIHTVPCVGGGTDEAVVVAGVHGGTEMDEDSVERVEDVVLLREMR